MTKEFERAGIPTALISTIVPLAQAVGVNRIIAGRAVTSPLGNPALRREEEKEFRRGRVRLALEALQTELREPLVVWLEDSSLGTSGERQERLTASAT